MRYTRNIIGTTATFTLASTLAHAAEAGRQDTSGVFVWAFLGVCALIIMAQAIPALLMAIGAARGVADILRERHAAKAPMGAEQRGDRY